MTINSQAMTQPQSTPYDWNWAELAEQAQQESDARNQLLSQWPHLPLFLAALNAPFARPDRPVPERAMSTPIGIPGLRPRLGFLACCLLNSDPDEGSLWISWRFEDETSESCRQLMIEALFELSQSIGPLNALSPEILRQSLHRASLSPRSQEFDSWLDEALVQLFQPFDERPDSSEDTPYAPCCEILLSHGARATARDAQGNSALSGINAMLTEAEVSMADPQHVSDLLLCAQLLLDAGAPPDSVRPAPPLSILVLNQNFRHLLMSTQERTALLDALDQTPPACPHPPPARSATRL